MKKSSHSVRAPAAPEIELCVESLGGLGDGIASYENKPVFIAKTLPGERVRVRLAERNRDGTRGELLEVLAPSPQRSPAPCAHYAECGGCTLQHLNEESYRAFKTKRARDALRLAGYDEALLTPLVTIPAATRRRTEFKLHYTPEGVSLAYVGLRSHHLVPIRECLVLSPALQETHRDFTAILKNCPAGAVKSLQLTQADNGIDVLLAASHLPDSLLQNIPPICIRISDSNGSILYQKEAPILRLKRACVEIPPGAFLQASVEVQKMLADLVVNALAGANRVADLFAGLGLYSFSLPQGVHALAVESDARMVEAVRRAGLNEVQAQRRDLFASPLTSKELEAFDAAIINPPRAGAKAQCEQIAASELARVAMVSCNPATFARDAAILRQGGFALARATPIDAFLWTAHVEIVAEFRRAR